MAAPIGRYPLLKALAAVVISGWMFQRSEANHLPVRPNPVTTSSKINNTPYLSQMAAILGQHSGCGGTTPAELEIGSPINAATVCGPSATIARSTSSAHSKL